MRPLLALMLAAALAGCGDSKPQAAMAPAATPITGRCPVTVPTGSPHKDFNYGTDDLAVSLWPDGELPAGELPDGGSYAEIQPDGSIRTKVGWWRAEEPLQVEGVRLDATAAPLEVERAAVYPTPGFQPTGLTFPTTGCWKVTGRAGDASISFVVRVTKLA